MRHCQFGPGPFSLLLLVVLLVRLPGVIVGAESFVLRDFSAFGLPLAEHLGWSLARGELPLWNPFNQCGLPFAAQWNTMVFYPPAWIVAVGSPAATLSLFCVIHLFGGGLGMYRLGRELSGSDFGGTVAGASYALHGLLFNSLMWPNNIAALAWTPWLVLAVRRAIRDGGGSLCVAGLAGGAQMMCGAPEIILFGWIVIGILLFAEGGFGLVTWRIRLPRLLAVVGLTAGLAAVQLLPFFELLAFSERWQANASGDWAAGAAAWFRWVVPLYDTYATPAGPRFHAEQSWTHSAYGGLLPLLVIGAAVVGPRRRVAIALVAVILVAGLCAHGKSEGVFGLLAGWLPMRFPVKLLIFHALAFPLVAALGAVAWMPADGRRPPTRILLGPGLVLATLLFVWSATGIGHLAAERQGPAVGSLLTRLGFGAVFVLLLLGGGRSSVPDLLRRFSMAAVVVTVILDLSTHQADLAPAVMRETAGATPRAPLHSEGGLEVPTTRATHTASARFQTLYAVPESLATGWQTSRRGLAANMNLHDHVPTTGGFYSLNPGAVSLLEDQMYAGPNGLHRGILELLAVSDVITYSNEFAWAANRGAVSMFGIGARPEFMGPDAVLEAVRQPDYTPREVVLFQEALRNQISAGAAPDARIGETGFTPHRIVFETVSSRAAVATISQTWYPCWRAAIDGRETTLWPANHAFMAVEVPAGRHRVEIIYEDSWFEIGRSFSVMTFLGCLFVLARNRFACRRGVGEAKRVKTGEQDEAATAGRTGGGIQNR